MTIEKMELIHFRNYEKLELQPHPEINLFFGENGSGKTNLLEAIHFCSLGKSHRLSQDANAVLIGEKAAAVRVEVRSRLSRSRIEIRLSPGEENIKSVWIDGNRASRLSEMMGLLRCVIFSPEDLNLIREGPAVRRRFLDMMISQISRPYFIALQQYRTAMNHRSAILRTARLENRPVSGMIEDFEQAMSDYAETIYRERFGHERFLSEMANEMYREISGREQETFQIQYRSCLKSDRDGSPSLKEALRDCREEDMKNGTTSVGPHRDDLSLMLNSRNMKNYASQGQMRTGALSLKLAQLKVIQKVTGENPDPDHTFLAVRGMKGWKEAEYDLAGMKLKVAVVSGLGNASDLLTALEKKEVSYDFVEVMACPGGCVGGGGQSIHGGLEMAPKRAPALYEQDRAMTLRLSHENPAIKTCYAEFLKEPLSPLAEKLLHTDQHGWRMPGES